MKRLFGTNGVRGVFGKDLTLELVHDLTLAIARHFGRGPILVGYDGRDTSPVVAKAVCSTLNYSGLDCRNAGLVPTPCLEYCVKSLGYAGGMMITASHNPPEYNGIKPVAADGVEISRERGGCHRGILQIPGTPGARPLGFHGRRGASRRYVPGWHPVPGGCGLHSGQELYGRIGPGQRRPGGNGAATVQAAELQRGGDPRHD